jgi:hypothetical protein
MNKTFIARLAGIDVDETFDSGYVRVEAEDKVDATKKLIKDMIDNNEEFYDFLDGFLNCGDFTFEMVPIEDVETIKTIK